MQTLSGNLLLSLHQIEDALQHINENIQDIVDSNVDIENEVVTAIEGSKGTGDIVKFTQGIAKQTNLLGLNASIEA